jgi:uncharacterized protein YdaU (DUF1376 family)
MSSETRPDVWFPLVVGDYLKDTSRLTTEQHGAYLLLLMDYWVKGPPPDSDVALSSITGLELRRWRLTRPTLIAYFRVVEGVWRHKRVDEEIDRWTERKRRFTERARSGGHAKAASSTSQAGKTPPKNLLKGCTASAPTEVDGLAGQSTLCGQNDFLGPKEVRDAFVTALGEPWCRSYLDHCGWQDVPERALIPATRTAGAKLIREARAILSALGLSVLERAA